MCLCSTREINVEILLFITKSSLTFGNTNKATEFIFVIACTSRWMLAKWDKLCQSCFGLQKHEKNAKTG